MNKINFNANEYRDIFKPIDNIMNDFEAGSYYKRLCEKYDTVEWIITYCTQSSRLAVGCHYYDNKDIKDNNSDFKYVWFNDTRINFKTFLNFVSCYKDYKYAKDPLNSNYFRNIKLEIH